MHIKNITKFAAFTLTALAAAGCSSADEPSDVLAPPPAGEGVQYVMNTEIAASTEVEMCKFVQAPADGLWVNRDEVRYTTGSHHFLLYETAYDTIPSAKDDGTPVDTSQVFDCSEGPTEGWTITRLIGGSQNRGGASVVSFPPDVAVRVRPGAMLMMNAHYVNTSAEAVTPDVRINLWTIPEAQVKQEGDILFWYNIFINVPEMGSTRAQMRCNVAEDITVTTMQSHMHARGTGYAASFGGNTFYENTLWEDVPVTNYADGLIIPGGTMVDYHCDFENPEAREVFQGPRSTDEMCMMIGSYYPAVPGLSNCSADPQRPMHTQGLGAEWVGDGTASCADTVACVQAADEETFFTDLQRCVAASDPAVSREMSDAMSCLLLSFGDDLDPTQECTDEFVACLAK